MADFAVFFERRDRGLFVTRTTAPSARAAWAAFRRTARTAGMEWNRSRAKRTKPVVDFTASELVPIEGTRSVFSTCIEVDRTFTHVNVVSTSPEGPRLTGIFFAAGHTWIVQEDSTDLEAFARTCSRHARSVGREVVKATERRITGASLRWVPSLGLWQHGFFAGGLPAHLFVVPTV